MKRELNRIKYTAKEHWNKKLFLVQRTVKRSGLCFALLGLIYRGAWVVQGY